MHHNRTTEAVKRNKNKNVVLTCTDDREYKGILIQLDSEYVTVKTGKRGRPPRIYMEDIKLILMMNDPDVAVRAPSSNISPQITRPINTAFEDYDDASLMADPEGPTLEDLAECELLCDEALADAL